MCRGYNFRLKYPEERCDFVASFTGIKYGVRVFARNLLLANISTVLVYVIKNIYTYESTRLMFVCFFFVVCGRGVVGEVFVCLFVLLLLFVCLFFVFFFFFFFFFFFLFFCFVFCCCCFFFLFF